MRAVSGTFEDYLSNHGPLNLVLFALLALVVVVAAVGLLRGGARREQPAGADSGVLALAPVLPAQRGQDLRRNRT